MIIKKLCVLNATRVVLNANSILAGVQNVIQNILGLLTQFRWNVSVIKGIIIIQSIKNVKYATIPAKCA